SPFGSIERCRTSTVRLLGPVLPRLIAGGEQALPPFSVKLVSAGVRSTLNARSTAATRTWWVPVQNGPKPLAASQVEPRGWPSMPHSNRPLPLSSSLLAATQFTAGSLVGSGGAVANDVCGAVLSIVKRWTAGVGSA